MSQNKQRSSKRLQDGGNVNVPADFRILVLFEEEAKYDILSSTNSKAFFHKKIGAMVKLKDRNGTYQAKIVFTGSHEECSEESDRLENMIRHDRNESAYHGSGNGSGSESESEPEDQNNDDDVVKSSDVESDGSVAIEISREQERLKAALPNTLPGLSSNVEFSRIGSQKVVDLSRNRSQQKTPTSSGKRTCAYPIEKEGESSKKHQSPQQFLKRAISQNVQTSTPTAKSTSKDDRSNGTMVDVLKEILAQQFRTNELLQAILTKVLEDGTDLRELKRPYQPTKYGIILARKLWSKRVLQTGIMEPQKPNKRKLTLDPAKVKLIKTLIEHFYNPKSMDKTWSKCRSSINQMCTDLKNKDPDEALDDNDDNDEDGGLRPL